MYRTASLGTRGFISTALLCLLQGVLTASIDFNDSLASTITASNNSSNTSSWNPIIEDYQGWMSPLFILAGIVVYGIIPSLLLRCCCYLWLAECANSPNTTGCEGEVGQVPTIIITMVSLGGFLGAYYAPEPLLRDLAIGAGLGGIMFAVVIFLKSVSWRDGSTIRRTFSSSGHDDEDEESDGERYQARSSLSSLSDSKPTEFNPPEPMNINVVINDLENPNEIDKMPIKRNKPFFSTPSSPSAPSAPSVSSVLSVAPSAPLPEGYSSGPWIISHSSTIEPPSYGVEMKKY